MGRGEEKRAEIVVIGVGNEYRGDDAVGLHVARRLREMHFMNVRVDEKSGDMAALIEAWDGAKTVFIIDAVSSGAEPGAVHRFEAHRMPIPTAIFRSHSTHAFGVGEAIELARAINRLPSRVLIYGIEGRDFETGSEMSTQVRQAAEDIIRELLGQLG